MTREIVFDTETTGLSPANGDRVVELGCVELVNHIPTGRTFHEYFNPEREMPAEAERIHGLTTDFLSGKPLFRDKARAFLDFVEGAVLIAHNAPFDVAFLNAELERCGLPSLACDVLDTVAIARQRHPGARVSLDALCKHYGIDSSKRTFHGALLDSEILAEVYLELIGGRQVALALTAEALAAEGGGPATRAPARPRPEPLPSRLGDAERAAHAALVASLGGAAIWGEYGGEAAE